ncbi:zinc-binding dehydrogenase [uncultured Amnibacterium sp.]|uniref:zinc-binding dehydrogenase n=1 Tax=uncultured Amnibacterium sp. TaxID=1631851 RepID=UPI0035CACBBA
MRAAVVTDFSQPPVLGEFAEPEPADGEVVVDVRAAAVSNLVRLVAAGKHYSSAARPPMVAGVDGVGRLPDGSLVYVPGVRSPWGTIAERAAVSRAAIRPVPQGLSAVQAAAVVNAAFASWLPLTRILEPGATPTVLVIGATGAAGTVAVPIAKHLGAKRVVAVGREGDALRRTVERGADEVVPIDDGLEGALERIGSDGVDVVLDFLWGETAARALPVLARTAPNPQHRIDWVNLGALGGVHVPLDSMLLRMSDLHVWGSGAGAYSHERRRDMVDAALDLAAKDVIAVEVQERALDDVAATWSDRGRLVYVP